MKSLKSLVLPLQTPSFPCFQLASNKCHCLSAFKTVPRRYQGTAACLAQRQRALGPSGAVGISWRKAVGKNWRCRGIGAGSSYQWVDLRENKGTILTGIHRFSHEMFMDFPVCLFPLNQSIEAKTIRLTSDGQSAKNMQNMVTNAATQEPSGIDGEKKVNSCYPAVKTSLRSW